MQPFRKTAVLATTAVAFLALAGLSPAGGDSESRSLAHDALPPAPIAGDRLFVSLSPDAEPQDLGGSCRNADDVLGTLLLDVENVGGDLVFMAEGLQQDFSDSWRSLIDGQRVEVSLVVAHIIPNRGGDPVVDVIEIDGNGCALSRTLLSAADWVRLLDLANRARRRASSRAAPPARGRSRPPAP